MVADGDRLVWELAAFSAHGASRGRCRACGTTVFWDAPGRDTVSFAAETLADRGSDLAVAAHIWVQEEDRADLLASGVPVERTGLPASVVVPWRS